MPPGMVGDPGLVRIGTGAAGPEEFGCPASVAGKARPRVRPQGQPQQAKPRLEQFALGPVMDVLDRIEFDGVEMEAVLAPLRQGGSRLHPGVGTFVDHAVHAYLSPAGPTPFVDLVPVRDWWVAQRATGQIWELYAWGRRYESPDGHTREFRFLQLGKTRARERDRAQVAVAAYAAAHGGSTRRPDPWTEPFQLRDRDQMVHRIRIVEVSLLDGSHSVCFDGDRGEVDAFYATHGRARVARIAAGSPERAGAACAGCKQLSVCSGPPRVSGLLGVEGRRAPLRAVSMSDLRAYRACPARAHLIGARLPRAGEYSPEAELGHAVHGWIETLHGRGNVACVPADMPAGDQSWTGGRWTVGGDMAVRGAAMLAWHPDVCPLQQPGISEARLEPSLAFHDPAAQAVVVAKPDMLYLDDDCWVWREVKTTQKDRLFHADLLDEFPQLALAVLVLAAAALGGRVDGSRVELEILRASGAEIHLIDPSDPERVAKARDVIRRLAAPWREDEGFAAQPGQNCRWCPVSRWCPSFAGSGITDDVGVR